MILPGYCGVLSAITIPALATTVVLLLISLRKQRALLDSLKDSEAQREQLTAILDAAGEGIGVVGADYRVLYQNKKLASMVGRHRSEVCHSAYHGLGTVCGDCPVARTFQDGGEHTIIKCEESPSGRWYSEITATPLKDGGGKVVAAVEIVKDVSDTVQTEVALRESEAAFRTQMNAMPVGVGWWGSDGSMEYVNRSFTDLFGYTPEDIPTLNEWFEKAFPDAAYRSEVLASIEAARAEAQRTGGPIRPLETRTTCKDGSVRQVLHHRQLTATRRLVIFTDLTERRMEEAALRRLNITLETLLTCNGILVRAGNQNELLQRICQIIRRAGGYRMVRVDLIGKEEGSKMRCVAQEGCAHGCLGGMVQGGFGPAETAMRDATPCLVKDVRTDPRCASWVEPACQDGCLSVLSVPLINGCEILGAVTIDAAHPDAFHEEDARLIAQLAGNLAYGIVSMRRAEEHRLMEEALGKSTRNLEEAQSIARLGSWEMDVEKHEEYRSAEFFRILGVPEHQGRARDSVFDYIHRDDKEKVLAALTATLERGAPYNTEYRLVRPDGAERTVHAQGKAIRDAAGKIMSFIGTVLDITERKAAEEALNASERRFRQLLENVRLPTVTLDTNGTLTFCNDFMLALTGWNDKEVLGVNGIDLFVPPEERARARADFVRGMETGVISTHVELSVLTRNGSRRDVIWDRTLLRDGGDRITGLACIGIDLTDHRRLEQQLRQSQKMEAIGQLAGGIAHDFNNMLTVIGGYGNILQMEGGLTAHQQECLEHILAASEKAAQLTNALLAFSRKQVMDFKVVNLTEVVRLLQAFLGRIVGEDIFITSSFHDSPLWINADRGQIEQVLMNLVTNARDALPKGGSLAIETGMEDVAPSFADVNGYGMPGPYAVLTVSDNGTGMDKETQKRIFDPFFTTKEVGKGTGLGMSIVYGIVKQHDGFIHLDSEPGRGTVFRVYFPSKDPKAAPALSAGAAEAPRGGAETILVAEDDAAILKLMEKILTSFGYEVIVARDGQEAVEKFQAHKDRVQLVVMDMIMPKKNGKEAYDDISRMKNIKVLYSSGYTMDVIRSRGELDEGSDLILKPVQPREFLKKVREVLDRP